MIRQESANPREGAFISWGGASQQDGRNVAARSLDKIGASSRGKLILINSDSLSRLSTTFNQAHPSSPSNSAGGRWNRLTSSAAIQKLRRGALPLASWPSPEDHCKCLCTAKKTHHFHQGCGEAKTSCQDHLHWPAHNGTRLGTEGWLGEAT